MGAELENIDVRIGSRRAERIRVSGPSDATWQGQRMVVLIHDLCVTGARIETRELLLDRDGTVGLTLPFLGCEQHAEVAWSRGSLAGLEFAEPLDQATFRVLAQALQPKPQDIGVEVNAGLILPTDGARVSVRRQSSWRPDRRIARRSF